MTKETIWAFDSNGIYKEFKPKKRLIGNLPKDTNYKIIKVTHFLESEELKIIHCHNCNKIIINIATVENTQGKLFEVGLDCAATLQGMNLSDLEKYNELVKLGISARKSIKNCLKSRPNLEHKIEVHTFDNDNNYFKEVGAGGYKVFRKYSKEFILETWQNYSKTAWENIVYPYISDLITKNKQSKILSEV